MLSIEEAQQTILNRTPHLETETVPLLQGLNRITAENHIATWDLPPADNSAMDGYAFHHTSSDNGGFQVTGFLPAGMMRTAPVSPGEAVRIMTGAPIPPACNTIVPIENVLKESNRITLTSPARPGEYIRRQGEDIRQGQTVVPAGSLLRPQEIGMLSAMGKTSADVYKRARVAVISTGDELIEPGPTLPPGKIIDSNSPSLAAQLLDAGAEPLLMGIAPDDLSATMNIIKAGLDADMLVISGGISVGERDFVKAAIEKLGGSIVFWKVNMKPGKPLAFAMLEGKPVFALPGNPVSSMVSFELFVRPALLKAMGRKRIFRPKIMAVLQEPAQNSEDRPHFMRVVVSTREGLHYVSTTGNQSSGRLSSLLLANGLIKVPSQGSLHAGDVVEVLLLDREFGIGASL